MKSLRFVHVGDMHIDYDEKVKAKIQPSLNQILDFCKTNKVDAVIIPGDLTHRKQSYANHSGIPMLLDFLKKLSAEVGAIFITKGNHDEPGSIALLHQLEANIFAHEYPVVLGVNFDGNECGAIDLMRYDPPADDFDFIVSLMPYPNKAMFLSDTSIDNNNAEFVEKFEDVFELVGTLTEDFRCPKILGFHGNVVGSRLSSGQTLQSQDIMVAPSTIEKAKADYYALNHIHLRQEIRPNMIYAGGIANFNWGETENKSFDVFEIGDLGVLSYIMPITTARPMVKLELEFKDGEFFDTELACHYKGYVFNDDNPEFRLRIKLHESDRPLITDIKVNELKDFFGSDVKIEFNIIPNERESRSEKIMNCLTLTDEVKEYGVVINEAVSDSVINKVETIQEGAIL